MIVYFSGTGNTAYAAKTLARHLGDEEIIRLDADMLLHPERHILSPKTNRIVWAFPTYSWGVPPVVVDFIRNVRLSEESKEANHYMLTTCGDDIGYADRMWRKEMAGRGLKAVSVFSLEMPNTYVCLPGFDVDSPELEKEKLTEAPDAIAKIAEAIENGGPDILIRKSFSWIKTYWIYPGFKKHAMSSKPFRHTDACISCGKCASSCPMQNISMLDGGPAWSDHCAMCLRCYHICHVHAVAYGSQTAHKGQYTAELRQLNCG